MGEMSMNKAIHGAVRRDLGRFVAALGAFAPGDQARADALGHAWSHFEAQLTDHHEGEHAVAWPALAVVGITAETIEAMDQEHEAMAAAMTQAGRAMHTLQGSPGRDQSQAALTAMTHLRSVTVEHLDHEEAELEPVLLGRHDDPALQQMSRGFRERSSLAKGGAMFTWILDGASPDERAAVTRDIPAPVVAVATFLFGRSYRRDIAPVWR